MSKPRLACVLLCILLEEMPGGGSSARKRNRYELWAGAAANAGAKDCSTEKRDLLPLTVRVCTASSGRAAWRYEGLAEAAPTLAVAWARVGEQFSSLRDSDGTELGLRR